MLIQSTKNLLDALKLDPRKLEASAPYQIEGLFTWQANLVVVDRRKLLFLMNDLTRYPVLLFRIKPKDLLRLDVLIPAAIGEAFRAEGITESVILKYLAEAGEVTITKTSNPRRVANLNHMIQDLRIFAEQLDESALLQPGYQLACARYGQRYEGNFDLPCQRLREALAQQYTNGDLSKAIEKNTYQLKISLKIPGHLIWRRVQVPAALTFLQLHNVIQTVFDWMNYHLHKFEVRRKGEKNLLIVMEDSPDFTDYIDLERYEVTFDRDCSLYEVFSKHRKVEYEYDFGDGWDHIIQLEKKIQADQVYPIFLEGQGERPPEDVGGLGGFERYLQIIADPADEEYESMVQWADDQRERSFTKRQINERLIDNYVVFDYYLPRFMVPEGRDDWDHESAQFE